MVKLLSRLRRRSDPITPREKRVFISAIFDTLIGIALIIPPIFHEYFRADLIEAVTHMEGVFPIAAGLGWAWGILFLVSGLSCWHATIFGGKWERAALSISATSYALRAFGFGVAGVLIYPQLFHLLSAGALGWARISADLLMAADEVGPA